MMDPMPRPSQLSSHYGSPDGSNATILVTVVRLWLPGWIQCHDPSNCRQIMALRIDPMPRSSTGATHNGSPDGPNPTILITVVRLWLSGWIQCHDPRKCRQIMALRMDATILVTVVRLWLPGRIQCHDPRKCRQIMVPRMDPTPRSSTGATQNGSPDRIQCHDPQSLEGNSGGRSVGAAWAQRPDPPVVTKL